MAFPPTAGFAGIGPTPGSSALDGPPPSPTPMGGPPDSGGAFSMSGLAAQLPTAQMPPEVLTGIEQSAAAVGQLFDSWAQVTPEQGMYLEILKQVLTQYLGEIRKAGGGPVSPTAPGPAFPGGGIDQGIAGPGSV